jgi:hypothetical protein
LLLSWLTIGRDGTDLLLARGCARANSCLCAGGTFDKLADHVSMLGRFLREVGLRRCRGRQLEFIALWMLRASCSRVSPAHFHSKVAR